MPFYPQRGQSKFTKTLWNRWTEFQTISKIPPLLWLALIEERLGKCKSLLDKRDRVRPSSVLQHCHGKGNSLPDNLSRAALEYLFPQRTTPARSIHAFQEKKRLHPCTRNPLRRRLLPLGNTGSELREMNSFKRTWAIQRESPDFTFSCTNSSAKSYCIKMMLLFKEQHISSIESDMTPWTNRHEG